MEDDVYEGMFIPKGTLVFANAWCVCDRDQPLIGILSAFRTKQEHHARRRPVQRPQHLQP